MGKTLGCNLRLWGFAYQGAPIVEQGIGKGNHPCPNPNPNPLSDIAPLEDPVIGKKAGKPLQGAGASTRDRLELILCQLVLLDINFLAKFVQFSCHITLVIVVFISCSLWALSIN